MGMFMRHATRRDASGGWNNMKTKPTKPKPAVAGANVERDCVGCGKRFRSKFSNFRCDDCAHSNNPVKPTQKFLCSYLHDNAEWLITIDAYDFADAEARVKKLGFLRLEGELMGPCR